MNKLYLFIFLLLAASLQLPAQTEIPTGTWRTHFNYTSADKIEVVGNKIYCASKNGFFSYGIDDNSLNKISKLNGLHDAGIGALKYLPEKKMLVAGYRSGNIDLITDDEVFNLNTIKKSNIAVGKKEIFDITAQGNLLFLSAGLGIVVVDLNTQKIKETYQNIGPEGEEVSAYQISFFKDSIFVATNLGVLVAPFGPSINLADFNSWNLINEDEGLPGGKMNGVFAFADKLLAYNKSKIFEYNGKWADFSYQPESTIKTLATAEDKLLISLQNKVVIWDGNSAVSYSKGLISPEYSTLHEGELWVADSQQGLVHYKADNIEKLIPNGPGSSSIFDLVSRPESIIALGGGFDENHSPNNSVAAFYLFEGGTWQNFSSTASGANKIPQAEDLVSGDYANGKTSFASFGDGILVWGKDGSFDIIDENSAGSTLSTNGEGELLISDVKTDDAGSWILNYGNAMALHHWDSESGWQAFDVSTRFPVKLLNSVFGLKWMIVDPEEGGGLQVFDPELALGRHLYTSTGNGGLPSNNITSIAENNNGEIWVGTDGGIVYYPDGYLALENNDGTFYAFDAVLPIVDEGIFLQDKPINDIMIDPGNRKWVATNEGVWVAEGNGGRLLFNFNEENSPLPSDRVLKMKLIPETGEVFFITDKGMVSYRSDVSSPQSDFTSVKIFPNPVYPRNSGLVTISGLIDDAVVKITDVTGKLVWETHSYGGTATWNTSTSALQTGIYLVFATDAEATEKFVGKIAVVR